jgi:hypothetical protein
MRKEIYGIFGTIALVLFLVSTLGAGGTNTPECVGGKTFEVSSTIPTNGARAVALDTAVTVTFNQDVECSTVSTSTFTLKRITGFHEVAVEGTVTCNGAVATFTPSNPLAANTNYTATITTGVKDEGGKKLKCAFVWCFKTGSSLEAPTVIAVTPLNKATGVGLNTVITAEFDQAMNPKTILCSQAIGASVPDCEQSCCITVTEAGHAVKGTITYNTTTNIATFTPTANLLPNTKYTVTIKNCVTNTAGTAMVSNFVWTFTTGAAPDIIPPTVILTNPLGGASNVPLNQIITATFSEAMAPATIISPATSFTLTSTAPSPVVSVPGTVTYAAVGDMATFTPSADLTASTYYMATITTAVTNLAGIHMLASYSWTFETGAATVTTPPTVVSTNPGLNATGVCINGAINATFSEALNPVSVPGTFTVTGPALTPVLGTVTLDVTGTILTFTPTSNLASGTTYTATISTGVEDLLGDHLATAEIWSFTTGTNACTAPVPLNSASVFGVLAGTAGITNTGVNTVINGDLGTTATAYSFLTGFHDLTVTPYTPVNVSGCIYTETPANVGLVTGEIYSPLISTTGTCPLEGTTATTLIATTAWNDASTAFTTLAGLPTTGPDPSASGNLGLIAPLAPGVYKSASGAFSITGGDLTLDGQGNANAVWVFQMSTTLTVGDTAPRNVILINGAQAKNVFWQVGSAATINGAGGGTMVGTIIGSSGVTFSTVGSTTITTLNGRAIGLNASVTMVDTVINVPAP